MRLTSPVIRLGDERHMVSEEKCVKTWPDWKQRFARYRFASQLAGDGKVVQVNALIYPMGAEAEHIFKSFTLAAVSDGDILQVQIRRGNGHVRLTFYPEEQRYL